MGNISSRFDEAPSLYLKDPNRFSIKSLTVSNGRRKVVLNLLPTGSPVTRVFARREIGDDTPISYIQEPESQDPRLLLRLDLEDELDFRFTFITKQVQLPQTQPATNGQTSNTDTTIAGLTFAYASTSRDLDTLITREFHADPNLHKNSNVQLVGDFGTSGSPSVEYEWVWRWSPPKVFEDRGGGWRNTCSFLEYDSRAHRLNTLGSFAFWVHNASPPAQTPISSPYAELTVTPLRQTNRIPSSQSYHSQVSDSEGPPEPAVPPSPLARIETNTSTLVVPSVVNAPPPTIDISCQRPAEDMSIVDDGPVFRATMKSLEQKTGSMRVHIKKVLKKAEAAHQAQIECNEAMSGFLTSLQEASSSNASAFKPALDHYFTKTAKKVLQYENEQSSLLRKQIIDPLTKLYNLDIKQADAKKKDFEEESRDYYAYVSRYLGQRQDSLKEKKRAESDSKYQNKKRNFELARFDYSAFMQDLHGGRKEQELLSQLTKYADSQTKSFLNTAKQVESFTPQLDALLREVGEADKEYKLQRTEREEKRRNLEMNNTIPPTPETEAISQITSNPSVATQPSTQGGYNSDTDLSRADSTSSQFGYNQGKTLSRMNSITRPATNGNLSTSPGSATLTANASRFRGIRDLEERELGNPAVIERQNSVQHRKEGLLWALSKPGSHIDPKGINKQAWHKFWIVLDQGKLSEYSNWKDKLDLHRDPIDLRMASVRMARDAERRFCFEVITPNYKRVYQATTEDEMNNWISAINNALQSAVEGRNALPSSSSGRTETSKNDYGAVLVGKRLSQSGQHSLAYRSESGVNRSSTVGSRPTASRNPSSTVDTNPTKLLDQIRANDQGNLFCADCGSNSRVEWTSLNLGIILCIECGGIHRSLGTHISKVRSLTLDSYSFTNDVIELLMQIGNRVSNMVWEAKLEPRLKPEPWSKREDRLRYITTKYVERAFVDPVALHSGFAHTDDALLASIKRNDIQGVLSAIAHRANVNAHDRSRNTHAVHLALIAADPARPVSPAPGTPATPGMTGGKKVTFPVAELLLQNGAEVPLGVPLFPLSSAALAYLDTRRVK